VATTRWRRRLHTHAHSLALFLLLQQHYYYYYYYSTTTTTTITTSITITTTTILLLLLLFTTTTHLHGQRSVGFCVRARACKDAGGRAYKHTLARRRVAYPVHENEIGITQTHTHTHALAGALARGSENAFQGRRQQQQQTPPPLAPPLPVNRVRA